MITVSNEHGGSRFGLYVFFLLLFLVIHTGYYVIPMYMNYSRMQDEMSVKAGVAQVLKDEEIVKDLVNKAKELDLPLTAESFILERDEERRRMKILTKGGWDVTINFLWGAYVRNFHFAPVADENFMKVVK
jgi:hypothetical protein